MKKFVSLQVYQVKKEATAYNFQVNEGIGF